MYSFVRILLYLLTLLVLIPIHSYADIDQGYAWLATQQQADGSIASPEGLSQPYQSTAESIITYEVLGQSDASEAVNGRTYLENLSVDSTENLALRLLSSPVDDPNFNTRPGSYHPATKF